MWSSPSSSLTLEAVCIVIIIIIILLLFIVIVSDVSPSLVERRGFFFPCGGIRESSTYLCSIYYAWLKSLKPLLVELTDKGSRLILEHPVKSGEKAGLIL